MFDGTFFFLLPILSICHSYLCFKGYVLRSTTGSSISSGTSSLEEDTPNESDGVLSIPPDHGQCSYCGSIMPQLRLLMHERHCATSNFKCPVCK